MSRPSLDLRRALDRVPRGQRDAWVDELVGIDRIPDDGDDLPPGCVPYLPCPVDTIVAMLDCAGVSASDVFVDLGSGIGRVTVLAHLLTGASAIGIEIQSHLVRYARRLSEALPAPRVRVVQGDAAELAGYLTIGTVFFLYCPFSGERLDRVLDQLEDLAATRSVRICTVDLPPLSRPWLELVAAPGDGLAVYRNTTADSIRR